MNPLSDHARGVLSRLEIAPIPTNEINPGVRRRLKRGGEAEIIDLPSPYKTRKGNVPHLRITETGRSALASKA